MQSAASTQSSIRVDASITKSELQADVLLKLDKSMLFRVFKAIFC